MPQDHAGHGFDFDVEHAIALVLGEDPHLFLRELDVGHFARGDLGDEGLDLSLRQAVAFTVILVEFHRHFTHGGIAFGFDFFQATFDDRAGFGVVFGACLKGAGSFQMADGHEQCSSGVVVKAWSGRAGYNRSPLVASNRWQVAAGIVAATVSPILARKSLSAFTVAMAPAMRNVTIVASPKSSME